MELPFEKSTVKFWQQKLYTPVMKEETQELKLPESMPDIGRVIAAWGQPVMRGKEWRSTHVGITGGVMVWVLYAPEDGGSVRRMEAWIPFSVRSEHQHTRPDGVIRAECVLCAMDARSVSTRKIMLRCQVGVMIQTMLPKEAELYAPGALPEDIQLLERSYPMVLTRETGERSFLVDEVVEVPNAQRVVYSRLMPRVTEQKVLGSRAVFRGVGELHLLCQDAEDRLFSADVEVPFAQYLDLEGDYEEAAEVSNLLCLTSLEAEPEERGIRVKCGLVSQYIINAPSVIRCAEDAYSPGRDVEPVMTPVELPVWLDEQLRQVELEEKLVGEEVSVDAIFFPDLPVVTRQPGGAEIRVGGAFQTLTEGPEGLGGKTLRTGKSISLDTACDTIPFTWLRGGTQVRREGGGCALTARMDVKLDSVCHNAINMVSAIRCAEQRKSDPERPSIIVRARKSDETLWDIAKYCGSTVSAIQRLNKLESEPEENRLLLIPVI